jgi:AcrR family transcriptional regulator
MTERDTEDRILDAAHTVFLRRGTAGARMHEVADEAGVNKALLHYYFHTKDQLAQAVFRRALGALLPRAFEIMESEASIEDKVWAIVDLEVEILRSNPFLPGYLLGELTHHPERIREIFESVVGTRLGELGERVRGVLGAQLAEAAEAGQVGRISSEEFVMNLIALVIFPFAARPLLEIALGVGKEGFEEMMVQRKSRLPEFFLNALRP